MVGVVFICCKYIIQSFVEKHTLSRRKSLRDLTLRDLSLYLHLHIKTIHLYILVNSYIM